MKDIGKSTPLSIPPFHLINTPVASPNQFWKVSVCASLTKSSDPTDRNPGEKKALLFKIVYILLLHQKWSTVYNPHVPRCYIWISEGYEQGKRCNRMSSAFGHRTPVTVPKKQNSSHSLASSKTKWYRNKVSTWIHGSYWFNYLSCYITRSCYILVV